MRIYDNCLEMVKEVERDLYEMGIQYDSATVQDKVLEGDSAETLELFGYAYTLKSNFKIHDMLTYMGSSVAWVKEELKERVQGGSPTNNPGSSWLLNKGFWEQYIREGCFSYSYPERIQWQLPYVINELKKRPTSRHVVISIYSAERDIMNWGGLDRIPCSVLYQFLIREGKLHVVYNERSCDFLKFFATDVFLTLGLRDYIGAQLNLSPGNMTHFIGSLHAFKTDLDKRNIF